MFRGPEECPTSSTTSFPEPPMGSMKGWPLEETGRSLHLQKTHVLSQSTKESLVIWRKNGQVGCYFFLLSEKFEIDSISTIFPCIPPRYPGSTFMDHVLRYQDTPGVKMIVVLGEVRPVHSYLSNTQVFCFGSIRPVCKDVK